MYQIEKWREVERRCLRSQSALCPTFKQIYFLLSSILNACKDRMCEFIISSVRPWTEPLRSSGPTVNFVSTQGSLVERFWEPLV